MPGAFGHAFFIGSVQIIPLFLIALTKKNIVFKFSLKKGLLFICLIILFCISLLNPLNITKTATLIAIYNILFVVFFAYIVSSLLPYKEIVKGVWDGLCVVAILELSLAVLYPVLGMTNIPEIFAGTVFESELRNRANGTFNHPNTMGAFMSYIFSFFASCAICNYERRKSVYFCCIAFCAIILTLSRSAILASIATFCFLYFINKHPSARFFSFRIFFKFMLPTILFITVIIFFTPLKKYFISMDAEDMISARMVHNIFYLNIVVDHPYWGVGLNTGVAHFSEFYDDLVMLVETEDLSFDFMSTNPVHNIFILLLVDIGIVGLVVFLCFMTNFFIKYKRTLVLNKNTQLMYNIFPLTAIGCVILVIIHGLSDYTPMAPTNIFLWLFFCLIAYYTRNASREVEIAKRKNVTN